MSRKTQPPGKVAEDVLQALRAGVGLRVRDREGLLASLDQLRTARSTTEARRRDRTGEDRLRSCESALETAARTDGVIRVADWCCGTSGRIRGVDPCIQQVPRVLRQYLVSELPGHHLIDCDLVGAHGQIAAVLAKSPEEGAVYTPEGRMKGAEVLGWTDPTKAQLKAVKSALLALQMGSGVRGLLKDHLLPVDATMNLERAAKLMAWWQGETPNIQARLMRWAQARYNEWVAKGRPPEGIAFTMMGRHVALHPSKKHQWRTVLASAFQSVEATIMDRTILGLSSIPNARLVTPMYDGILVSAPANRVDTVAEAVKDLLEQSAGRRIEASIKSGLSWPV